jgi:hypothetical protein
LAPKASVSRPTLQSEDSLASTVDDSIPGTPLEESTDVDMEEALEETQTDEIDLRASPEPLGEALQQNGDEEPLEVSQSVYSTMKHTSIYLAHISVGRL